MCELGGHITALMRSSEALRLANTGNMWEFSLEKGHSVGSVALRAIAERDALYDYSSWLLSDLQEGFLFTYAADLDA